MSYPEKIDWTAYKDKIGNSFGWLLILPDMNLEVQCFNYFFTED